MKKIIFSLTLLLMVLASCQYKGGAGSGSAVLSFDSLVIDSTVRLNPNSEQPNGHLSLHLIYAKPQSNSDSAAKAANLLNDSLLRSGLLLPDFAESVTPPQTHTEAPSVYMMKGAHQFAEGFFKMYLADYKDLYRDDQESAPSYNRSYTVFTHAEQGADSIVNYLADTYFYSGGAHGQAATWARNFNARTGAIVHLTDVLRPGYERPLTSMIVAKLARQFKVRNLKQLQDSLTIFAWTDPYIPDNYIINEKGITFIYNPDEIAAHVMGEIRVTFSNKQLSKLLRKK